MNTVYQLRISYWTKSSAWIAKFEIAVGIDYDVDIFTIRFI